MTPKQKAKELVDKYRDYVLYDWRGNEEPVFDYQKQCALIAVDEILKIALPSNYLGYDKNDESVFGFTKECHLNYWKQVKQEIEKL